MKTRVGPGNHVLGVGADLPTERGNFPRFSGPLKFGAAVAPPPLQRSLQKGSFNRQQRHAAEGIIQYAGQEQIGIRKILRAGDAAHRPRGGDWSAERGRSLISTMASQHYTDLNPVYYHIMRCCFSEIKVTTQNNNRLSSKPSTFFRGDNLRSGYF